MFIEFSTGNYLSFKNLVTFSMVASSIQEHKDTHLFKANKYFNLLKTGTIYGANASGKSNLFKAMQFMVGFVESSSKDSQAEEEIPVESFKLSTETEDQPSTFEMVFIQDDCRYRYGFQVNSSEVVSEWLFEATKQQETNLFERSFKEINIGNNFIEGKGLDIKTRDNALFLSVVAQFNGEKSIKVLKWFKNFNVVSGLTDSHNRITSKFLEDKKLKELFLRFIQTADLGIEDIIVEKVSNPYPVFKNTKGLFSKISQVSFVLDQDKIFTTHKKYNPEQEIVGYESFSMDKSESQGTKKLFSLLGPIMDGLINGKTLVIDELDSRLHPLITNFIISLFQSTEHNPKNSQLIFNTHDTNLLSNRFFRRDQLWFTEKDKYGSSDLYSLSDFEVKVRNDASFEKDYLLGKYGAIPFLGEFCFEGSHGD